MLAHWSAPGPAQLAGVDQAQRFPVMPVEVGEPALVPVAVVPRRADGTAARRLGLAGQLVDLVAGFHAEDEDHLGARRRVHDAAPRVGGERRLGQQHDLGVLADDHRRHVLVLAEERQAEFGEEGLGPAQVLDRQVDEKLGGHGELLRW